MKNTFYFFIFLIMSFNAPLSGQNPLSDHSSPWAVSFSISPKFDISPPYYAPNDNIVSAFCLNADQRIFTKFSYSLGVIYNNSVINTRRLIYDGLGSEVSTNQIFIIEFPVQFNFHLLTPDKMVDPFFMTSLNNSYSHQNYYGESYNGQPDDGDFSIERSEYCLFYNIGLGAYLNISSSFSIIAETSVGFGLVYYTQKYRFIEGQLGLRYTLK